MKHSESFDERKKTINEQRDGIKTNDEEWEKKKTDRRKKGFVIDVEQAI
jgi:hypothetical protein